MTYYYIESDNKYFISADLLVKNEFGTLSKTCMPFTITASCIGEAMEIIMIKLKYKKPIIDKFVKITSVTSNNDDIEFAMSEHFESINAAIFASDKDIQYFT